MTLNETYASLNKIQQVLEGTRKSQENLNELTSRIGKLHKINSNEIEVQQQGLKSFFKSIDLNLIKLPGHAVADSLAEASKHAEDLQSQQELLIKSSLKVSESAAKAAELERKLAAQRALLSAEDQDSVSEQLTQIQTLYRWHRNANNEYQAAILEHQRLTLEDTKDLKAIQAAAEERDIAYENMLNNEQKLKDIISTRVKTEIDSVKVTAAALALEKVKLPDALKSLEAQSAIHAEQEASFHSAQGHFLETQKHLSNVKEALDKAAGVLVIAAEFSGVLTAVRQQQMYAAAVRDAQGTLLERQKLIEDMNATQALTGLEAKSLVAAEGALVERGLDRLANNRENLKTVAMLAETFGIAEETSAHMVALSSTIGINFRDMGDTVATLARNTGLTAKAVADTALAYEKIRVRLGGSAGTTQQVVSRITQVEGVINSMGGPGGIVQQMMESMTSNGPSMAMATHLGLGNAFNSGQMFQKPEDVNKMMFGVADWLQAVSHGNLGVLQAQEGMIKQMTGLSTDEAIWVMKTVDKLKNSSDSLNTVETQRGKLLKEYMDQQNALSMQFGNLQSRLQALMAWAVSPIMREMVSFLEVVNQKIVDLKDWYNSFNDSTKGVIKFFVENITIATGAVLAFATALASMEVFNAIKGIASIGKLGGLLGKAGEISTFGKIGGAEAKGIIATLERAAGSTTVRVAEQTSKGVLSKFSEMYKIFSPGGVLLKFASKLPLMGALAEVPFLGWAVDIGLLAGGIFDLTKGIKAMMPKDKIASVSDIATKQANDSRSKQEEAAITGYYTSKYIKDLRLNNENALGNDLALLQANYSHASLDAVNRSFAAIDAATQKYETDSFSKNYASDEIPIAPESRDHYVQVIDLLKQQLAEARDTKKKMVESSKTSDKVVQGSTDAVKQIDKNNRISQRVNHSGDPIVWHQSRGTYHKQG